MYRYSAKARVRPLPVLSPRLQRVVNEEPTPQITDPCRVMGGHRKMKKQGKGTASSTLFHPLVKPRLSERKTYRELEAMINPPPKQRQIKWGGKFRLFVGV